MGRSKADSTPATSVTLERAARLSRLLKLIAKAPRPRELLLRKLDLDVRAFYRDLKALRDRAVAVTVEGDTYQLSEPLDDARGKLLAPDPLLSVADLRVLSRGHADAHRKLRRLLDALDGYAGSSNGKH